MKLTNFNLVKHLLFLSILTLLPIVSSCGDDNDEPQPGYPDPTIPENAVQLNMMNESNGKSLLGNTDVYLSDGNNLVSSEEYLIGKVTKLPLSLSASPELSQLFPQIAVETKNIYQIFAKENLHKFPSGISALKDNTTYINAYVESWINKKKKKIGAKISFLEENVTNDFPFGAETSCHSSKSDGKTLVNDIKFGNSDEIEVLSIKPENKNISIDIRSDKLQITTIGPVTSDIEIYVRDFYVFKPCVIHITPE